MMRLEVRSLGGCSSVDCMGNSSTESSLCPMTTEGGEDPSGATPNGPVKGLNGEETQAESSLLVPSRVPVSDSKELATYFAKLFRGGESKTRDPERKKNLKKNTKSKDKSRKRKNSAGESYSVPKEGGPSSLPQVRIPKNPSPFAVFSAVRSACLESQHRESALLQLKNSSAWKEALNSEESEPEGEIASIPKVVGIGLSGVLEIIRESRTSFPSICQKALESLLNILQGLSPEELSNEPPEIMDLLFETLMTLSVSWGEDEEKPCSVESQRIQALSCSCLFSFVVSYGDTGKILRATSSLLMSPKAYEKQLIPLPSILVALQRSIVSVMIGRIDHPDIMSSGINRSSLIDTFSINYGDQYETPIINRSTSDGQYLYAFADSVIFKIGTGYSGTIKGHVYYRKSIQISAKSIFWAGYACEFLFLGVKDDTKTDILRINKEALTVDKTFSQPSVLVETVNSYILFSDGLSLGLLTISTKDTFLLKFISPEELCVTFELPLKLAYKSVGVLGASFFEEGATNHEIDLSSVEEECISVQTGCDIGLILTSQGKVYYTGKSSSIGFKHSCSPGEWIEMSIPKSPRIAQVSLGHDGQHALLLTDDGIAFFIGIARRGEDGEQTKARRPPKPAKPKKFSRMEGHVVTQVACNDGTSAFVTKEGELFLFGKDSSYCDCSSGQVTDLKGSFITQVAVGRAHIVALTKEGEVFTFGMNSKGQCGRDYHPAKENHLIQGGDSDRPVETASSSADVLEDASDAEGENEGLGICPAGKHSWKCNRCMVCTICLECTGYGPECVSSAKPDRNPGMQCGCGPGESGCAECGCCRSCAGENDEAVNDSDASLGGAVGGSEVLNSENNDGSADMLHRHLIRLDLIATGQGGSGTAGQAGDYREKIIRRTFSKRHNFVGSRNNRSRRYSNMSNNSGDKSKRQNQYEVWKTFNTEINEASSVTEKEQATCGINASGTSSSANTKLTFLAPAKINLMEGVKIIQISSGHHHTIMLDNNGDVYTFGNNLHGELGVHDLLPRGLPTKVNLPCKGVSVAAGSYHSLVLTEEAEVYSFGMYRRGQLGRECPIESEVSVEKTTETREDLVSKHLWFAIPGLIPRIGPRYGRIATWIGASSDQTFIKVDESLINAQTLEGASIVASRKHILLLPSSKHSNSFTGLVINKTDGFCRSFDGPEQVDFTEMKVTIDPYYNVIWSFSKDNMIRCYHPISSMLMPSSSALPNILSPELALPSGSGCMISRNHASLNMLSCLDTLTQYPNVSLTSLTDEENGAKGDCGAFQKKYSKEDFNVVNRFDSHGGGWGYSSFSIEAIRFMADTDILVGGFGLFGGRGEYVGKIKIFDIGFEGGDQETDGEMLAESEEVTYKCASKQKYPILFDEPVSIQACRWYVAWARVDGPSSDCGSSGQIQITTEELIQFHFKSSKKSNNGTDVNAGQVPQILYKVLTSECTSSGKRNSASDPPEPVCILNSKFFKTVTPECFSALLSLLRWSWSTFKSQLRNLVEDGGKYATQDLQRLVYICRASLRLIIMYTDVVYPMKVTCKTPYNPSNDTAKLAETIYSVRMLLQQLLTDPSPIPYLPNIKEAKNSFPKVCEQLTEMILKDAHRAYVACFHAFYPTGYLKWACLCNLLTLMESSSSSLGGISTMNIECDRLLTAVLDSLCNPLIKLRNTFPIAYSPDIETRSKNLSPSDNLSLATSMIQAGDGSGLRYPILAETMNYLCHGDNLHCGSWSFREVLDRLLNIGSLSIKQNLLREQPSFSSDLVEKACKVISSLISELTNQSISSEPDIQSIGGRILHVTPNRFTRTGSSRTWNTGNGTPDAICFSVDKPGIFIAGCCVYGGVGTYEYQLELLDDQSNSDHRSNNAAVPENGQSQRWISLEVIHGNYSSDDCINDIAEIKFDRAVSIRPHFKYALRLRNNGGRTSNGDVGLSSVKGPDGTTFSFNSCSLSCNGTNPTRGQLPQILYYSSPHETEIQSNTTKNLAEKYARRTALSMTSAIVKTVSNLLSSAESDDLESFVILNKAPLITTLMPHVLASISSLVAVDPNSSVAVLAFIQDMLPHVATLNNIRLSLSRAGTSEIASSTCSRSHYAYVESPHPYKPSTIYNYRVYFPENVKWLSIEFDPKCATSQPEDSLQLYIKNPVTSNNSSSQGLRPVSQINDPIQESQKYIPVLRLFRGPSENWPSHAIVLPGNEVLFSLETASDYLKEKKANQFGFQCLVIGYEGETANNEGLKNLEKELAYLGGICAQSLMKKNLCLTQTEDMNLIDESAGESYEMHYSLLSKGLALSHPPTIHEALDGIIPYSNNTHERIFLKNFVNCVSKSAGGRLARWLQPESYVDVGQCRVIFSKEDMRCNWPNIITVVTQDQYGDIVWAPAMKVEVRAVPIENDVPGRKKIHKTITSEPDAMTFGGMRPPNLDAKYEVTVKDKMFYHSITVQKSYEMYSFEELRFASPTVRRQSKNMLVKPNNDGTYSANWTPSSVGWYQIHVTIDGVEIQETYKVEVYDPPQGILPPGQQGLSLGDSSNGAIASTSVGPSLLKSGSKSITTRGGGGKLASRLRQFLLKNSAGLRIRVHPTLQSEQIGIIPFDGIISIIDELQNSDGLWVRLSIDSLLSYCNTPNHVEGWCLQYNQHILKTLMVPISEKGEKFDSLPKKHTVCHPSKPTRRRRNAWKCPSIYKVSKCGASGHNIRAAPSLSGSQIGMLNSGDSIYVINIKEIGNEIWVQLGKGSLEKYCLGSDCDAWSLAVSSSDIQHLELHSSSLDDDPLQQKTEGAEDVDDNGEGEEDDQTKQQCLPHQGSLSNGRLRRADVRKKKKKKVSVDEIKSPSKPEKPKPPPRTNLSLERRTPSPSNAKPSFFQKWFKGDQVGRRGGTSSPSPSPPPVHRKVIPNQFINKDIPPELQGVSVKELVKVIGESRANGNGVTPPGTPGTPRRKTGSVSQSSSRSGSPSNKLVLENRATKSTEVFEDGTKKKQPSSPVNKKVNAESFRVTKGPVKEALSPSVAESIRSVFAAFVWHENIIHDTIAAASFLKFHPNLNKSDDVIKSGKISLNLSGSAKGVRNPISKGIKNHRHSMEISSALPIGSQLLNQNSNTTWNNANENTTVKRDEIQRNQSNIEESVCPPTLKLLAVLWEEIRSYCIHAILQQVIVSANPLHHSQLSSNRFSKPSGSEKKNKVKIRIKSSLKSKELSEAEKYSFYQLCEMCGQYFGHPVTYHMRLDHPGCGSHAGGKGYNSGGNYCDGWAGNCGDGGVGGSSWYLICGSCRENYMKIAQQQIPPPPLPSGIDSNEHPPVKPTKSSLPSSSVSSKSRGSKRSKIVSSSSSPNILHSPGINSHVIMKNNAAFLLDLSSSNNNNNENTKISSSTLLHSVSELTHLDPNPFPIIPFQSFNSLCVKESVLKDINEELFFDKNSFKSNNAIITASSTSRKRNYKPSVENDGNGNNNEQNSANFSRTPASVEETVSPPEGFQSENDTKERSRVSKSVDIELPPCTRRRQNSGKDNRKRNSSCEEQIHNKKDDDYFLSHPSHDLQKLFVNAGNGSYVVSDILQRPVMGFVLQWNDLESLQFSMTNAIRKAACRNYAIQALNWLLRSVCQPDCIHDLLWFFVASLENSDIEINNSNNDHYARKEQQRLQQQLPNQQQQPQQQQPSAGNENLATQHNYLTLPYSGLNEHPLSDLVIGGEAIKPLTSTLYALLQTISDLMLLLPLGSPLLQIAVTCWALKFKPIDHQFLHQSHVFSSISKILSHSEESDASMILNNPSRVQQTKDLTSTVEIKVSSRQTMLICLSDNSTETFWESGEEDRNKTKWISLSTAGLKRALISVHIDNCRDLVYKVSGITFKAGQGEDDLVTLRQTDVESRFAGWISCFYNEANMAGKKVSLIKIELKGPDNTLRVRQVKLLGKDSVCPDPSVNIDSLIKQRNCESETLRVFRLMTAQVFGKLLQQDHSSEVSENEPDLREHVVGILFHSKMRLSYLQKQVCSHIVQAIKTEALILKEDWELSLCHHREASAVSDTYCFEMLSLVLALSGSTIGKIYLSQQHGLILDLLNLLHTGTARIQRQVISLIRRILPEISPVSFASIIGVDSLPPKDFGNIVNSSSQDFDFNKLGLLDIFLSCLAKALTVQVKYKGGHSKDTGGKGISVVTLASSIHPKDHKNIGVRWWLKGSQTKKIAEEIVNIIKDLMNGKLGSSEWVTIAKSAIAQNIVNLTKLDRTNDCLKLPVFWLGLASICVLDKDHVEGLTSGDCHSEVSGNHIRSTCDNHDDGETIAIIKCETCGNLCGDCDRFLHLHRRTKSHVRAIFKEEEDAIKVDLHEGCGRMKLYWLMALADFTTLKAMVEFREATQSGTSGVKNRFDGATCRFCGIQSSSEIPVMDSVCTNSECVSFSSNACVKTLTCGHYCGGILNEEQCLPCLHGCAKVGSVLKQDSDDMCMICFTEALSPIPSIMLTCGHVFHYHCCLTVLKNKWNGPRITFGFCNCPICKVEIQHPSLKEVLAPIQKLYEDVKKKTLMRLEYEGLMNCEAVTTKGGRFYNDCVAYGLERYAYYVCFKCSKAYYGGEAQCDAAVEYDKFNPEELVCGGCSDVSRAQMCLKHGMDYLEYKCRYCCSVAVFFCFGTTHFCNSCHDDFQRLISVPQKDLPQCPVGPKAIKLEGEECPLFVKHPPTGEEFALGCGICRNPHTF